MENPSQRWEWGCSAAWEVLVEAGVKGKAGEMQVTPGANCMQQIYLQGAEGCASRMSQLFK